jgi:signal peptidase II
MKKAVFFSLSLLVILLDQLSKHWALVNLADHATLKLIPILNLTLVYNTGAAFSFLSSTGNWHQWFFTIFSITMSIVLTVWLIRLPKKQNLQMLAVSLILGGAIGNLIDRLTLGHVVDFIEFYYKNHHWFVFNIADAAISAGAVFLFIDLLFFNSEKKKCRYCEGSEETQ